MANEVSNVFLYRSVRPCRSKYCARAVRAGEAAQVMGPEGKPSHFFNFCPEVSFEQFGWFSSNLSYHADEIDIDVAHRNLAEEGATEHDWRWTWSLAKPLHYSECSLYSPLLIGAYEVEKNKSPIGFGH